MVNPQANALSDTLLNNLKDTLAESKHMFACGGEIPIIEVAAQAAQLNSHAVNLALTRGLYEKPATVSAPVAVRWDGQPNASKPGHGHKILFPLEPTTAGNLERLVADMAPATFGRGGQDVYDEAYRKALKLDPSEFCSTFNPYESGIVDTVAQMLLPTVIDSTRFRAVRAELYKLNIYTGPSGRFRPHVDTPRSVSQFGSLVVCLPLPHQGGQLAVRHHGQQVVSDWSWDGLARPSIKWAAFYSDCEHEVLEVTSGHRVTLTYNLYVVRGAGRLAGSCPALQPASLPLFSMLGEMLRNAIFMEKGGKLGYFCRHAYAHGHKRSAPLPDTLKGTDMELWEVMTSLGLQPRIRPVIDSGTYDTYVDSDQNPADLPDINYNGLHAELSDEKADSEDSYAGSDEKPVAAFIVGRSGGAFVEFDVPHHQRWPRGMPLNTWAGEDSRGIHWISPPKHPDLEETYMAYGNNAELGTMYSYCGIIVDIPSALRRFGPGSVDQPVVIE